MSAQTPPTKPAAPPPPIMPPRGCPACGRTDPLLGDALLDFFADMLGTAAPEARRLKDAELEKFLQLNRTHFRTRAQELIAAALAREEMARGQKQAGEGGGQ